MYKMNQEKEGLVRDIIKVANELPFSIIEDLFRLL